MAMAEAFRLKGHREAAGAAGPEVSEFGGRRLDDILIGPAGAGNFAAEARIYRPGLAARFMSIVSVLVVGGSIPDSRSSRAVAASGF
ncbi:MAG: hypothetical protein U5L46_01750 [Agrobacterium sp.]|nr:hypothetical protein [Agrobacterium sp.]